MKRERLHNGNNSNYCCLVAKLCLTLCDPIDCSMSGFPVLHHLPEFAQTHVHWVGDATQPSHPLSAASRPVFSLAKNQVFPDELSLCIRWPKYWSFSFSISPSTEYSGLISFRIDWFDLLAIKGFSKVFSSTTIQKCRFFGTQPSLWSNSHIWT